MAETKCYMIVLAKVTDRDKFQAYAEAVPGLVAKFGGRYVLQSRGLDLLEGDWCDDGSMVISEWPDRATAQAFWNSPEYDDAKKLREGTGQFHVVLADAPQINVD